jgi:hypothetical protein
MNMKTMNVVAAKLFVVAAILLGTICCPPYLYGYRRDERALMDTRSIAQALQTYEVNNGHFPQSLQELTKRQPNGNAALLKPSALLDPWNQPYHFDPGQLHPETGAPLVWSDGEPGDADGMITNWQEGLKLSFWQTINHPAIWLALVIVIVAGYVPVRRKYFVEGSFLEEWAIVIDLLTFVLVFTLLWLCYLAAGKNL